MAWIREMIAATRHLVPAPGLKSAVGGMTCMKSMADNAYSLPDNCPGIAGCPATLDLAARIEALERRVATDALTGLWNRAHFDAALDPEIRRSLRLRQPLSLLLIDVDHFKDINDRFGHQVGDQVLCELARLAATTVRDSDRLFRWGGEEFAVLALASGHRGATRVADSLRAQVAAHAFPVVGPLTISIGVAEYLANESADAWFQRADLMLYAAKCDGRNRVRVDAQGNSDLWAAAHGACALHLVWEEAYESGNPLIDREHRELFDLANELIDAFLTAGNSPDRVAPLYDQVLHHVARHFADEEAELQRLGYARLDTHRRIHAGLLERAQALRGALDSGDASLGGVIEFLAGDVVSRHLLKADQDFFPLFAADPPH
jgi:diguanylate cyclase (GGDEF)-like protein/hemerythrin-like metal-binding protein